MIVEILSVVLGSSLLGTIFTSVLYYNSNKRLKELEIKAAEANAKLKETEAKVAENDSQHKSKEQIHEIMTEMYTQIKEVVVNSGDQIDILNKHLLQELQAKEETTARLRKYQDEVLDSKKQIIKLTEDKAELQKQLDHYKNWLCEREYSDCGRRKPEQKIKCPYRPYNEQ